MAVKFILIGRWKADDFPEYVKRAEKTLSEHPEGYDGVRVIDRYYAIGERMFFSIVEADSGEQLMKVVSPYLDLVDIESVPVLQGDDATEIWTS
jgi:DNA-binding Lrp family transcriptional regulator